eukprot:scaffold13.g255.t1
MEFVITVTGLSGETRRRAKEAVLALRGCWSGALVLGSPARTTHLVVAGPRADPDALKVRAALAAGLPMVSLAWLEHSRTHGFFLAHERYLAEARAPTPPRRPTGASTTLEAAGAEAGSPERLRAAPSWAAAPRDDHAFVALPGASPRQEQTKCRGGSPAFLPLAREQLGEQPPSPHAQQRASPEHLSQLAAAPMSRPSLTVGANAAELSSCLPLSSWNGRASAHKPALQRKEAQQETEDMGEQGAEGGIKAAGAQAAEGGSTPAAAGSSGSNSAESSGALVARFLSRAPQVTVRRRTVREPRRCSSTPESGGASELPAHAASRPSSARPSPAHEGGSQSEQQEDGEEDEEQIESRDQRSGSGEAGQGTGAASPCEAGCVAVELGSPPVGGMPRRLLRYSDAAGLALPTTSVELGAPLPAHLRPSPQQLASLRDYHGLSSACGVAFYASARCTPQHSRRTLTFDAGDACHGARMLFDVLPTGQWVYARVVLVRIYSMPDGSIWMEHKYALERSDLEAREAWAACLRRPPHHAGGGMEMGEEGLLLTVGVYHSPLALVQGEFGIAYRAPPGSRARPQLPAPRQPRFPLFECRHAFDAAAGRVVPLRLALAEFAPFQCRQQPEPH